jgi:hypothetical protein
MPILAAITFFDLSMALLAVAVIDRALCHVPTDVVGPGGWLWDTGARD